jgi:hypothetical protein
MQDRGQPQVRRTCHAAQSTSPNAAHAGLNFGCLAGMPASGFDTSRSPAWLPFSSKQECKMNNYGVTVVRALTAQVSAESEEAALRKLEDQARRGKLDTKYWEYYWESREPVVFAVPYANACLHIAAALEALHKAKAAHHDPEATQTQRLRTAHELALAAMSVIRHERAGADAAEVVRAAELAFLTAKIFARAALEKEEPIGLN